MAIRTINRALTAALPEEGCEECVWAGYRFEDNATELVFDIREIDREGMLYRIDFNSAAAGYHPSENLTAEQGLIKRSIPEYITRYGGELQATAVAVTPQGELYCSYPVALCFTDVEKGEETSAEITKDISEMEREVRELAETARVSASAAELYKNETEAARVSLTQGTEFVLLGGTAEQAVAVELTVDGEMSDISRNPVENRVVKEYIASEIARLEELISGLLT